MWGREDIPGRRSTGESRAQVAGLLQWQISLTEQPLPPSIHAVPALPWPSRNLGTPLGREVETRPPVLPEHCHLGVPLSKVITTHPQLYLNIMSLRSLRSLLVLPAK